MTDTKLGQAQLPNGVIERHVGKTSFTRGRSYANKNLVREVVFDKASLKLSGTVKGSNKRPYTTTMMLKNASADTYKIASSDCSCPVGYGCKHVAALALVGRARLYAASVPEAEIVTSRTPEPKLSTWEKQLSQLYDDTPAANSTIPLALFFELVEVDNYGRTGSYAYYYGRHIAAQATIKLGLRPALFNNTSGKWLLSEINWKSVRYSNQRFDERQLQWLRELWTLYTSGLNGYYANDRYLFLDDFPSPHINQLLAHGQESLGVAYLNGNKDRQPLLLASAPATAALTVDKSPHNGLTLTSQVMVGDQPIPPERIGFIGSPAQLIYVWEGDAEQYRTSSIVLAPLDKPLSPAVMESVKQATVTQIPKDEIPRFMASRYPKLARQVRLQAAPGLDVPLPELFTPQLQLQITYKSATGLTLYWSWQYRVGDQTFELSLHDDQGTPPVARHEAFEQELYRTIETLAGDVKQLWEINEAGETRLSATATLSGIDLVNFTQSLLPRLKEVPDVMVIAPDDLPDFAEFTDMPTIEFGMSQQSDNTDWFDLAVTVKLGEEEVPFEALFTALSEAEEFLVLETGSYFRLDHPELERLRQLIAEARGLQDKPSDSLRLSPFQAGLWDELMALGIVSEQAAAWERSVKGLLDLQYIPKVPVPKNLKATLRPYQVEGYQWLHFLWEHRLGGILADDMGLGKTPQTIALLLQMKAATPAKQRRPVLIVAPTSVAANWASELQRFAPSLKVHDPRDKTGTVKARGTAAQRADIVLTTYGLFRINFEDYQALEWSVLVLDEAQFVKNHQSKSYQCARRLAAPFKLALTGTPLENNLMELWSLLSVVAPGLFPSPKRFGDFYLRPIEKEGNREILAQLRRRVRPLMLRRTKEQVVTELPPKIEQTLELELNPAHQKIYDTYLQRERQRVLGLLGDLDKNRFMIFKSLTTLRLLSLDARLVDAKKYQKIPSTKLEGFFEQLEPVLSEGHRALVFSQFTSFLKLLREELDRRQIPYLYLDGSTRNRAQLLEQFKSSNTPLFLISLKAGGFGLNLTEADYCFLLDPWWNPAVEQQAVDRTHRIGQTKQVIVYRLVSKGTIEEKVMALKERKGKLFKSMMDEDAAFASAITPDDIRALFE